MFNRTKADTRLSILACLFVLGLITAVIVLPFQFGTKAAGQKGLFTRTSVNDDGLPKMWDIREQKGEDVADALLKFRQSVGKDSAAVANTRDEFARGEAAFKQRHPDAKVEYNTDIRTPEVMTPDVYKSRVEWLSAPSSAKRSDILRNFVRENQSLIGVNDQQINGLKVTADYTNPDGNLSYAHLEQEINGIPVFRGEVKAGFTRDGQIIRVINNLAPGLEYDSLSTTFGDPVDAVRKAAGHINHDIRPADVARNAAESTDLKVVFGQGDWATTAEKMYFPTEPGVAVPSWRILIWRPVNAYYVIVDANTGIVLWHKNIADDQTQSATYQVYGNPNAYNDIADDPAPLTPGPNDPSLGTQGAIIARTTRTLVGNEGTLSFNNNGWITDGGNTTDGNATEAGIDRDGTNGVDAPQTGIPNRVFDSTWNPPPGNPAPGDDPLTAQAQRGAVIQMFYIMNRYHDELYKRGFTEQARNFQASNFGRGGVEADRVSSEGQDSSGTNNANFATPADGGRGRMQMYLWTGPTPDKDGTTDAGIVIHEVTHGTSNRLHNNGSGLGNQGGMMGEGWGDWYASTMMAEPTDPINAVYSLGGYGTHLLTATFTSNYYYAIRRFPTAVIAFTGGPQNKPHNPLTFGHINVGCDTTLGTTTTAVASAFPRNPAIATSGNCSQVHNAGEIWKSALWEVRALLIARLGFQAGTTKVLQLVTDGMKLSPTNPMMLQERDAIIAAAAASPATPETSADVVDVREGFRRRGFGFSASTQSSTAVTEAFDLPNVTVTNPFSVSDSVGDNDGFPEPTEPVLLSVAITNTSGAAQTNVVGSVTGGGTANYGTINDGQTVTRQIAYTVPGMVACGALHQVSITASSDAGAQAPVTREFRVGVPVGGAPATFSNTAAITINDNAPATPYPSNITVSGLTGNKVITMTLTGISHTFPGDIDLLLVGPGGQKFVAVSDSGGAGDVSAITMSFTDGAAALPSTTQWVAGEFRPHNVDTTTDVFAAPAPAAPYENPAPGGAATFASAFGTSGTAMNGTWSLYARDDAGIDTGSIAGGWSLTFGSNDYNCSVNLTPRSRADFDGDGKTDVSAFRPSEGNWYLNRSTAGFSVINWGLQTDAMVPGDFDGDLKADTAVFRAAADPASNDFYCLMSNGFVFQGTSWGVPGDKPISGDYDGDGKTDFSVFRPSTGTWYVLNSGNGSNTVEPFGLNGDIPMAFDLEGDGKTNLAVYRPSDSSWYIARATGVPATNYDVYPFGTTGDLLVPADYDGDNKDDVAVFRPSNGTWYIRKSSDGSTTFTPFGSSGDRAVPGDYDGDGKDDIAVYRAGTWYLLQSTAGAAQTNFGVTSDIPVPLMYIPAQGPPPGSPVTVSYTGAAVAVPDNSPAFTNVPLAVAGVGTVSDLNFRFDTGGTCDGTVGDVDCAFNHTWVGDLIIRVTPPDGSPTVVIFDRPGVPATAAGCNNNNIGGILLNDEGAFPSVDLQGNPSPGACVTGNLFPTGNFSPFSPLSALDGESADGNWTISISDNASGDTGSLRRFSLEFNSGN